MIYIELTLICRGILHIKLSPLVFFFHSSFPHSFYMLTSRKTVFLFPVSVLWVEKTTRKRSSLAPSQDSYNCNSSNKCSNASRSGDTVQLLSPICPWSTTFPPPLFGLAWFWMTSETHIYQRNATEPFKKSQTVKTKTNSRHCSLFQNEMKEQM